MKRLMTKLLRRTVRRVGYELRPVPSGQAAELTKFPTPTDAIYTHRDPIFEVPLERCYYPYVFSYGPDGWHPFVETLRELLENPSLTYPDSALHRYYQTFQPRTIREALFEEGVDASGCDALGRLSAQHYLPVFPWDPAPTKVRGEKGLEASHGHQGYGPVSEAKGELEFRRLTNTLRSIKAHGYRPALHGDGEIRGYFLKAHGDYRFIVRSGLHRTAALAALGNDSIRAGLFVRYPRAIHLCDVAEWPLVRDGLFSSEAATRFFERFFRENGRERAARLGLLNGPQGSVGSGGSQVDGG